jgi:hypothetical protein
VSLAIKYENVYNNIDDKSAASVQGATGLDGMVNALHFSDNQLHMNCWRCGYSIHTPNVCRIRYRECYNCGQKGHVASMYKKQKHDSSQNKAGQGTTMLGSQQEQRTSTGRGTPAQTAGTRGRYHNHPTEQKKRPRQANRCTCSQQQGATESAPTSNTQKLDKYKTKNLKFENKVNMFEFVSDEGNSLMDSDDPDVDYVNMICKIDGLVNPYRVRATINGIADDMCIDTCASVTVVTYTQYIRDLSMVWKLIACDHEPKTFDVSKLDVKGKCIVNVHYNGVIYENLVIIVVDVDSSSPPLLGLSWLQHVKIDWSKFKNKSN